VDTVTVPAMVGVPATTQTKGGGGALDDGQTSRPLTTAPTVHLQAVMRSEGRRTATERAGVDTSEWGWSRVDLGGATVTDRDGGAQLGSAEPRVKRCRKRECTAGDGSSLPPLIRSFGQRASSSQLACAFAAALTRVMRFGGERDGRGEEGAEGEEPMVGLALLRPSSLPFSPSNSVQARTPKHGGHCSEGLSKSSDAS
jgi:hypothetical protein